MPRLARDYRLNFTGGEPLLSFELVRRVVRLAESENAKRGLRARYSLTTNGSLLTPVALRFLGLRRFTVTVSYDGPAQDAQRRTGSSGVLLPLLERIGRDARLRLRVNSVFTPRSVSRLAETVRLLLGLGVPDFRFSLSVLTPWSEAALRRLKVELGKCRRLVLAYFRRTGRQPLENFRVPRPGKIFRCAAGRDRLALAPDGRVYGCYMFIGLDGRDGRRRLARDAAPGSATLDELRRNPEEVPARLQAWHGRLSMDAFRTVERECFLCPEVGRCAVCPAGAAAAGATLGRIPVRVCRIQRILLAARSRFEISARSNKDRGTRRRIHFNGSGKSLTTDAIGVLDGFLSRSPIEGGGIAMPPSKAATRRRTPKKTVPLPD